MRETENTVTITLPVSTVRDAIYPLYRAAYCNDGSSVTEGERYAAHLLYVATLDGLFPGSAK